MIAAVASVVSLGACAPRLAQLGSEMRTPEIADGAYVTRDGLRLGLTQWLPESGQEPQAVIVALHGMSDYSNAFAIPAPYWAARGIATYAYDQRGFGRSPNRGLWAGSEAMRRDLADFVDVARARHPGVPVFVLGESMGGAVAVSAFASGAPPQADGLVLVSPAVWGWRTLPFLYRLALWTSAHTAPWWHLSSEGLDIWPSDNIEMLRAFSADPLVIKGARADAIYGLVVLMSEGLDAVSEIDGTKVLMVYGGNDQIIPGGATEAALEALSDGAAVKFYPDGYHMILRDLNAEPRWGDIAEWVLGDEESVASQAR